MGERREEEGAGKGERLCERGKRESEKVRSVQKEVKKR